MDVEMLEMLNKQKIALFAQTFSIYQQSWMYESEWDWSKLYILANLWRIYEEETN